MINWIIINNQTKNYERSCCISLLKRCTMKNILPIKDKWFPGFAFLYQHNLQEIGSLTQVESLHIQTVLVNHNIVRVYLLKKKIMFKLFSFYTLLVWLNNFDIFCKTSFHMLNYTWSYLATRSWWSHHVRHIFIGQVHFLITKLYM